MKYRTQESGLGILATIVILAVLGVGGYAVYNAKVKNDSRLDIQSAQDSEHRRAELETMVDIKGDVLTSLASARAEIALHSQEGIDRAYLLVNGLRLRALEASRKLTGEAQGELENLSQALFELETSLEAESDTDYAAIDAHLNQSMNLSDRLFRSQNAYLESDVKNMEETYNPNDNEYYVSPEGETTDQEQALDAELKLKGNLSL